MQAAGIDAFGGEVHMLELEAPGSPTPDEDVDIWTPVAQQIGIEVVIDT